MQNVLVQYTDIDNAVLDKVYIVKEDFLLFGETKKITTSLRMRIIEEFDDDWIVSQEQTYDWGSVITMGADGNSAPYQLAGWSGDEAGYVWSDGSFAILGFKTPPATSDLTMLLSASGLSSPVSQVARVSINQKYLREIVLSDATEAYEIRIPVNLLRDDGVLLIRFDFPYAISPFDLGSSNDVRVLSMALRTIVLDLQKK